MIEYMDKNIIVAFTLLFLMLSLLTLDGKKKIMQGAVLLYFALIAASMINNYLTKQENIKSFKRGGELKCSNLDQEYSVSKKANWKIKQHYFEKESLLIEIIKCEEF